MFTFTAAKTNLRSQKGFSLVELMVVVAIIGVLAAIGIPSMQKYIAKARQSEVKGSLAGIYTAEKAFYAEYNTYTGCFDAIGYQPEGNLRYRVGFTGLGGGMANASKAAAGYSGVCTDSLISTAQACGAGKPCQEMAEASGATLGTGTPEKDTFHAAGNGLIFKSANDAWSIDQNKNLTNGTPGVN